MPKNKLDILEQKKQELETELERIQLELDDSIHKVRSDFSSTLDPIRFVKNHPWPVIGVSFLIGFLISGNGRKKSSPSKDDSSKSTSSDSEKVFSPVLFKELKKMAARRAASIATNYLEEFFQSRRSGRSASVSNGRSVKKD